MSSNTPTAVLSDVAFAERLKKAITRRDNVSNRAIRVQAEVEMAEKNAKAESADAKAQFNVDSLSDLRTLAVSTYEKDMADLLAFENDVAEYEAVVQAAEKILADASA